LDEAYVLSITGQTMYLILLLSSPMLMAALVVGLTISIIQATTQVQEQTLSFVPKIVATFMALIITGSWIASMVSNFAMSIFNHIANMGPR
jgi:flagellar biosynthetic protein FliQ